MKPRYNISEVGHIGVIEIKKTTIEFALAIAKSRFLCQMFVTFTFPLHCSNNEHANFLKFHTFIMWVESTNISRQLESKYRDMLIQHTLRLTAY